MREKRFRMRLADLCSINRHVKIEVGVSGVWLTCAE